MNNDSHNQKPESLAERVIDRIEEGNIRPRPRWEFLASNAFFWSLGALSIALGALAAAAALFEIANAGWRYYAATHPDLLTFLLQTAPILWVIVLAVFTLLGYENIRRTRRGYRYPLWLIVAGAVLASIVLGTALFASGFGEAIEESIGDHPPFYRPVVIAGHALWEQPSQGLLGGQVLSIAPDYTSFTLKDFNGVIWTISTSDLRQDDLDDLTANAVVRVVGVAATTTSANNFHGCFVFPYPTYGSSAPPPPRIVPPATTSEIIAAGERSDICKGLRPYGALHALHGE